MLQWDPTYALSFRVCAGMEKACSPDESIRRATMNFFFVEKHLMKMFVPNSALGDIQAQSNEL